MLGCSKNFWERKRTKREKYTRLPQQNWTSSLQSLFALLDVKTERFMNPQVHDVSFPALRGIWRKTKNNLNWRGKVYDLVAWISMHVINTNTAWKVCVYYPLVGLYQKFHSFVALSRSISDTYQLVRKYHTDTLSMKYSKYIYSFLNIVFSLLWKDLLLFCICPH